MDNFYRFKPELDSLLCGDLMTELKEYIGVHPNAKQITMTKKRVVDVFSGEIELYGFARLALSEIEYYREEEKPYPEVVASKTWKSILQHIQPRLNYREVLREYRYDFLAVDEKSKAFRSYKGKWFFIISTSYYNNCVLHVSEIVPLPDGCDPWHIDESTNTRWLDRLW